MNFDLFPALLITLIFCLAQAGERNKAQPYTVLNPIHDESIYNLNSEWTTQDEKVEKMSTFRNHPVVLAMIYTSCKDACPLIVLDMQKIEHGLAPETLDQVQFALVSFDPEIDTPKRLKEYAKAHRLDLKRWTLFHGSHSSVRELAAILDIRYKKLKGVDFTHSDVITVLDSEGIIKYQQVGLNSSPTEALDILQKMTKN